MKPPNVLNRYWMRKPLHASVGLGLLLLGSLVIMGGLSVCRASLPASDDDVLLKPLVDTSQHDTSQHSPATLQGNVEREGTIRVNDTPSATKTMLLTGKIQTLQQAIESEKNTVNWYGWYLSARNYLSQTGGIHCPLGTPIKFHKNGQIEALSFDPYCISSVAGRHFALPENTQLDALILPVRPGQGPPASPQEINARVRSLKFQ